MGKGRKKMNPFLKILIILISLGVVGFGGLLGYVTVLESRVPKSADELTGGFDAVIVLGAQVKPDGEPSVQLSWRLDTAVKVWHRKNVPIVVCGAQGKDEPATEATVMKQYLSANGIPEEMILTDPDSFNTQQNLKNAKALLDRYPGTIRKVVIVTSDYHVPRSMALAEDLGMNADGIGSPCLQEFWIKNHSREALAWVKYWMNKYLHLNL